MKKRMKALALILALVMMLSCLSACGQKNPAEAEEKVTQEQNPAEAEETVTLQLAYTSAGWEEANNVIIEEFQKKYPHIKLEYMPVADDGSRLSFLEAKIAANDVPDIFAADPNASYSALAEQGWLADLSDTEVAKNTIDACKGPYTSESGILYGIPYGNATCFVFYNKTMFEEAGITSVPTSWEEFLDVCKQLKDSGVTPCIVCNGIGNDLYSFSFAQNVVANDPDWQTKVNEGTFDFEGENSISMLNQWAELVPYVQEGAESTDYGTAQAMFAQGMGAMKFGGSWEVAQLDDPETNGFETGTFPFCFNRNGEERSYAVSPESGLAINAKSEHLEEAKLFLDFMLNERYDIINGARGSIPHLIKAPEGFELPACIQESWNEMAKFPVSGLLHFVFMPSALQDGVAVANAWQAMVMGVATPDQAAADLQQTYLAAFSE